MGPERERARGAPGTRNGWGGVITGEVDVSRERRTLSIACSAASLTAGWRRRASAERARRSASSAAMKAISASASASDLLLRRGREAMARLGVRVLACAFAGIGSGRPRRTGLVRSETGTTTKRRFRCARCCLRFCFAGRRSRDRSFWILRLAKYLRHWTKALSKHG